MNATDTSTSDWARAIAESQNPFHTAMTRYARAPIAFVREVLHVEPDPWQLEALRAIARGHTRIAIRSGHGVGKFESVTNLIDTPEGRRRWGDLRPGDRLFGRDGEPAHIVARHDQGVKSIYRVTFDDGTFARVGGPHLWTVRGRAQRRIDSKHGYRKGEGRREAISDYAGDFITITTDELIRRGVKHRNGVVEARQWELPPHGAVQYPSRDVPIPPYLLGACLADGSFGSGVQLHGSEAKATHWRERARELGITTTRHSPDNRGADRVTLGLPGLRPFIDDLSLGGVTADRKFIPDCYLENTPAVRLLVLQGLMDGDGYAMPGGQAIYTSVSRHLAKDVAWLVRSLGGKAHLSDPMPSHYTKSGERVRTLDHYDVTVRLPHGMAPFTLPYKAARMSPTCQDRYLARWIESIEPDGEEEAMCVTVDAPDGLYLTNDFIVTHNTAFAAWVMTWFANTRSPFKIAVTAPSAPQLFDALWPELVKWFRLLPDGWSRLWDITSDHITLKSDQECFITARTSRSDRPEAMAGLHSDHVLLVADEASGIEEAVYEAAGGSMSSAGAITLLIGNPTRASGFFWRCHMLERDRWFTMRVSSVDSPRVTRDFVDEVARRYGIDSNAYRIRVLGEFPAADDNTLIAAELVDQAMLRDVALDVSAVAVWGVDVARFGTDASVLIKRQGNVVTEMPRRWRQFDTMQLSGAIKAEYDISGVKPALVVIDVIGIGAGVVDRLHEQNLPILGVNVSEVPSTTGRYARLRDELWVRCREWLETRAVRLPRDDQLRDDLVAPRYAFLSDGRLQVESKNLMRSRGLASPDCFVSGTMIATPYGERPIESLAIGDEVMTPFGSSPIIAAWDEPAAGLTTVSFSNGRELRGTGHHKVFCWGIGIKRLDALIHTDRMEPLTTARLRAWRVVNLLCIGARSFGFRQVVDTINQAGKPVTASACCTAAFGRTFTVLFQKALTFTTRITTGVITRLVISSCETAPNTSARTCESALPHRGGLKETRFIWPGHGSPPPNGTARRKGGPGMASTPPRAGKSEWRLPCAAIGATRISPLAGISGRSSVQRSVGPHPSEIIGFISRTSGNARGVARNFWRIVIAPRPVVPERVVTESVPPTPVHNLTLERDNAYYANGILVFNSADALIHTFAQQGLGIASGMTSGLHDSRGMRMDLVQGDYG